jgi:hypothetical protein
MSFNPDELQQDENREDEQSINSSVVDEPILSPEERQAEADELERMREDSTQKDAEDLDKTRKELEGMFNDGKTENKDTPKNPETEKTEAVAEAMKEVDSFLREAQDLGKVDLGFVKNGDTMALKLNGVLFEANPKELSYRAVLQMAEKAARPIRNKLHNIEKNNKNLGDKTERTEIEDLLQKASGETDPKKIIEYTKKATQLFDELIEQAQEKRSDNKNERGHLVKMADENHGEARKERTRAEKTLGRGGYGVDIKNSIVGIYADRSRMLAEFMAVESGKIDKRDKSFQKNNEERKNKFKKIAGGIL